MSSEAGEGASTSTSPTKEQMDAKVQAMNLLAQGKRNLICHEIPAAVQQFQDACRILGGQFGEMAKECGEAYFHYGGALLDLARMEQGVLGNALEGVDVDADDEGEPNNKEQFEPTDKVDEEQRMELRMKVVDAMSEDEISNQAFLATGKKPVSGKTSFEDAIPKEMDGVEMKKGSGDKDGGGVEMKKGSGDKDGGGVEMEKGSGDKDGESKAEDMEADNEEKESCELQRQNSIEKKVAGIVIAEVGDEVDGECPESETEVKEAMEEDAKSGDSPKDKKMEGTEEEDGEEGEEEDEEGEDEEGASQEEGEEAEDPDDISNLQLSWEMLEFAKIIYSRDPSKESQLKLAETYLKLGEVGLESEQYDQAISDFESCLKVQKEHLDPYDRAIAETYYQLGLACQMSKQLDKAKESFTSAVTCLEKTMEKLKAIVEEKPPKSPSQFVEPAESAQREIKEILEILPEIKEKIADTEEEIKDIETVKLMAKKALGSIFTAASSAADSNTETGFGAASSKSPEKSTEPAKAMDISHLIRKKRKPEEGKQEEEDLENKKQKQEGGSGDAAVNGVCEKDSAP